MNNVQIVSKHPSVEDYCQLRRACGWPVPDTQVCQRALAGSLAGFVAVLDGRTIGMGRIVGDGSLINYIQDLIVLPEYQGKGIGKAIMDAMMAFLGAQAAAGSDVALISAPKAIGFYQRYGFAACTADKPAMRRKI
jgi:ribosomal protein S18 acetylase RimI-like enzyme